MAEHADASRKELTDKDQPPPVSREHAGEGVSESPNGVVEKDENAKAECQSEEAAQVLADEVEDYEAAEGGEDDGTSEHVVSVGKRPSSVMLATVVGLVMVAALGGLSGWFGHRAYQAHQSHLRQQLLVQVARQAALNLSTIDWQHADTDIQRILGSATGAFYDDFSHREKPFVEVVKKAQSKSVGTVTEAGVESQTGDAAQVLVALSVTTSNFGANEQDPRHWRMRITVQKVGNEVKVSDVAFVP